MESMAGCFGGHDTWLRGGMVVFCPHTVARGEVIREH